MKLADFRIGDCFLMSGKRWRCTDIGSRVVVAICVEHADIASQVEGEATIRRASADEAQANGWFNGPPYAVVEHVIDETDQMACEAAQMPRIDRVDVLGSRRALSIIWRDGAKSVVDLADWIATGGDALAPLLGDKLFASARVSKWGEAVEWGDDPNDDFAIDAHHLSLLADHQARAPAGS